MAILVLAGLVATGCTAQAARDPASAPAASSAAPAAGAAVDIGDLSGTQWRFVEVGGAAVPAGVPATLRFRGNHASGKAGCNAYGASFHVAADGSAGFTQNLSTKMACLQPPGAMQVERGIFAAFRSTAKVALEQGELVLLDAAGKPLAKLAPYSDSQRR
jgi:heat shock protein HslJ